MVELLNVADIKDPRDPQGRTFREINASLAHNIPIGTLVELENGARMFVVYQTRDCDQTPLYYLSHTPEDTIQHTKGFRNSNWVGGFSEEGLKQIRSPAVPLDI